jgi:hypothetical protein
MVCMSSLRCETSNFCATFVFQLLNDPAMRTVPKKFSVCENGVLYAQSEVSNAIEIMRKVSPSGVTPLTQHILNIQEHIADMADELRRNGKIVAIILATDGTSCLMSQWNALLFTIRLSRKYNTHVNRSSYRRARC